MDREERRQLARKRLVSVLGRQVVANARTLEQKISDAGPNNQRIDPHILTPVRREMQEEGIIEPRSQGGNTWYFLGNTQPALREQALTELVRDFKAFSTKGVPQRVGQALEIATYKALQTNGGIEFFGRYPDLTKPQTSGLFVKEEPPQHIGRLFLPGDQRLDFLVRHQSAGHLGLECKNIREWIYPDRDEIRDVILKCLRLNCIPVLIARRIPFVTFKLMNACGIIVHQTYNQLLLEQDADVAVQVRRKDGLGYHDVRVGTEPDTRLLKFIQTDMLNVAPDARAKFEEHKDLLWDFASGTMKYPEFAARVRRRNQGVHEDSDDSYDDWI